MKKKQIVAVVGRPNVGKSTFVNRLVGKRQAIVDDAPGITRDRLYFDVEWQDRHFTVIDTGGIIPEDDDEVMKSIYSQASVACEEADKIVFVVDGLDGINPIDSDIANILRRSGKPVFLAVNKIDTQKNAAMLGDFYELSLGEPHPISALHGSCGVGDLLDLIVEDMEIGKVEEEIVEKPVRIAIVGRPNVGKSSIVNALLGEKRVIVSNVSGTTRDSIDSDIVFEEKPYILVDTAGIRKKSKVDWGVEKFAVDRAIKAVRDCDVAVLVIDASEGITDQDKKIASTVVEAGRGLVIAVNKWDLIEGKKPNTLVEFEKELVKEIPFLDYAPKIYISALTHQRIQQIFVKAQEVYENCIKKISTGLLNKIINEAYALNPPQSVKGKTLKIKYTTQISTQPPFFAIFVNNPDFLKDNYKRYIENKLREAFGFVGTPIRISVRGGKA